MDFLLIGKGFLGEKILSVFKSKGISIECASLEIAENYVDITKKNTVKSFIEKTQPENVILTASVTNVDLCEEKPELAFKVNVNGTKNVVEACKQFGAKLIFLSTDFVFDGEKGNYSEQDKPNPLNVYGSTKLEGEKIIQEKLTDYLILRTSTLYGFNSSQDKNTFVNWVLESLQNEKEINVVFDQITCPTLIDDIAFAIEKLVDKKCCGLFHCTGSEPVSRAGFAKKIALVFDLSAENLKTVSSSELNQLAKRPRDASLNIEKILRENVLMSDINTGLKKMKSQMQNS